MSVEATRIIATPASAAQTAEVPAILNRLDIGSLTLPRCARLSRLAFKVWYEVRLSTLWCCAFFDFITPNSS
jgi:hypothetical protein